MWNKLVNFVGGYCALDESCGLSVLFAWCAYSVPFALWYTRCLGLWNLSFGPSSCWRWSCTYLVSGWCYDASQHFHAVFWDLSFFSKKKDKNLCTYSRHQAFLQTAGLCFLQAFKRYSFHRCGSELPDGGWRWKWGTQVVLRHFIHLHRHTFPSHFQRPHLV